MTTLSVQQVIAGELAIHCEAEYMDGAPESARLKCAGCNQTWSMDDTLANWTDKFAAHQSRAVLAALGKAGNVEWGRRWDYSGQTKTAVAPYRQSAIDQIKTYGSGYLVSRITGPWTAVEG